MKTTDDDPSKLQEVIRYYESKVLETQKTVAISDPLKVAIISGIILADELLKEKVLPKEQSNQIANDELEKVTKNLIERLNSALS